MSLKEKAVKGVFWSALQKWGEQAISFCVFLVLARLLGPEAFGLVALSGVFLSFIQTFLDQGFAEAIVQRKDLEPEHLDTAFWVSIGMSVLLTGISIACAGLVANFFKEPQLIPVIRWLSLSFVLRGLNSVQGAILRRNLDFKSLAVRSLIGIIVSAIFGVTMAMLGFGVWSLVGQQLSNLVVGVPLLWWVSDWRPGLKVSAKHFKELFSFGINITGLNLLTFLSRRSDNLLIGYFLGSVALGYYNVAYRLLEIMTQLLTSITAQVALPVFSKMQQEPERIRRSFYKATQFTSLISFPAFLGVAVMAPELVQIMFGNEWLQTIPVMQILSLSGIINSVFFFNSVVLVAMGKPSWRLWINTIGTFCNVVSFVLVVKWGITAVAAAYTIRAYVLSPIPPLVLQKLMHIKLITYLRQFATPLIASLLMAGSLIGVRHILGELVNVYALLAIAGVIGIAVYTTIILLIEPLLAKQVFSLISQAIPAKAKPKL